MQIQFQRFRNQGVIRLATDATKMLVRFLNIFSSFLIAWISVKCNTKYANNANSKKESNRKIAAFYITGHGLGHASRSVEICKALERIGFKVLVVSVAPDFFFEEEIPDISVRRVSVDSGAIQSGPLTVDAVKTLEKYYSDIHLCRSNILNAEVKWLEENQVSVVVCDASPLACRAAKMTKNPCKSVCISNFTWDYCYQQMLDETIQAGLVSNIAFPLKDLRDMILTCSKDYGCLDLILRLPGFVPIPAIESYQVNYVDCPLLVRPNKALREDVRRSFGFAAQDKVLLLQFGGHGVNWEIKDCFLPKGWKCLLIGVKNTSLPSERWISVDKSCYVPDLLLAADVSLGKIGYGTVSESASSSTPLIYVPRTSWPEEKWLKDYLDSINGGVIMSEEDFLSGNWHFKLEQAYALREKMAPGITETDGVFASDYIAQRISQLL